MQNADRPREDDDNCNKDADGGNRKRNANNHELTSSCRHTSREDNNPNNKASTIPSMPDPRTTNIAEVYRDIQAR